MVEMQCYPITYCKAFKERDNSVKYKVNGIEIKIERNLIIWRGKLEHTWSFPQGRIKNPELTRESTINSYLSYHCTLISQYNDI